MGEALIRLENLSKVFYTDEVETHALANIHLNIDRGEYVAIAGPSGCGKSTLLSILGLLDSPTEGTYVLNNQQPVPSGTYTVTLVADFPISGRVETQFAAVLACGGMMS